VKFRVLGSNSKGNCYLLQNENETLIIEAGISFKEIKIALDFNLRSVCGCLITHEHGDHSKAVKDVLKSGIRVYTSKGTIEALELNNYISKPIKAFEQFKVSGFTIMPFDVHHDVAEPLGFLINHKDMGTVLFATDTSYLEYRFKELTGILIECNYSEEILLRNMDNGSIDSSTGARIASTHMSLENCKELIKANDNPKLKNIVLLHLSDGNSNAKEFKEVMEVLTHKMVHIADKGLEIKLNKEAANEKF
jgi:phosphoribosyl 1,2-cyclic phosphodiesterase